MDAKEAKSPGMRSGGRPGNTSPTSPLKFGTESSPSPKKEKSAARKK